MMPEYHSVDDLDSVNIYGSRLAHKRNSDKITICKENYMVVIKIKGFTYRFLKRLAKGGQFKSESCFRDGHYYIEIDDQVFRRLNEIDPDDLDRAIFYAVLNFF